MGGLISREEETGKEAHILDVLRAYGEGKNGHLRPSQVLQGVDGSFDRRVEHATGASTIGSLITAWVDGKNLEGLGLSRSVDAQLQALHTASLHARRTEELTKLDAKLVRRRSTIVEVESQLAAAKASLEAARMTKKEQDEAGMVVEPSVLPSASTPATPSPSAGLPPTPASKAEKRQTAKNNAAKWAKEKGIKTKAGKKTRGSTAGPGAPSRKAAAKRLPVAGKAKRQPPKASYGATTRASRSHPRSTRSAGRRAAG